MLDSPRLFCHPAPLSASELSLTEVRDKVPPLRRLEPGLMPLPDTAGGLEWSSLVSAAKAYEGEPGEAAPPHFWSRTPAGKSAAAAAERDHLLPAAAQRAVSLFSLTEPQAGGADGRPVTSPVQFHTPQTPRTTPTFSGHVTSRPTGKFSQLTGVGRGWNVFFLSAFALQGRGAQPAVLPASPPGSDVTTAEHRFGESEGSQLSTSPLFPPQPGVVLSVPVCSSLSQEKQDKVVLLAEMANLRENNQRLQEESLTTTEQLRKFSRLFSNLDKVESHHETHSLAHGADSQRE